MNNKKDKIENVFEINDSIHRISNMITHFAFRNGPIEKLHGNGLINDEEMYELNKYMMNKIATIIHLLKEDKHKELITMVFSYDMFGTNWDEAIPCEKTLSALDAMMQYQKDSIDEIIDYSEKKYLELKKEKAIKKTKS